MCKLFQHQNVNYCTFSLVCHRHCSPTHTEFSQGYLRLIIAIIICVLLLLRPSVTHPERHIMVTRYTQGIAMILMTNRPLFPRPASWFLCCANNMRVALCKCRRFVCSALAAQNHHVKGKYDTIGRCHRANGLLFVKMYFRPLKAFLHTQNKEEQRGGA